MSSRRRLQILILATVAVFIGFFISAGFLVRVMSEYRQADQEYQELNQYVAVPIGEGELADSQNSSSVALLTFLSIDFEGLAAENGEIAAWIDIPGTGISYPVVRGEDNDRYLATTFRGEANRAGCIFMDYRCVNPMQEGRTILYGHNMRNRSMFGNLREFQNADYLAGHPYLCLYLPDGSRYLCQIIEWFRAEETTDLFSIDVPDGPELDLVTCVSGRAGERLVIRALPVCESEIDDFLTAK